VRAAAESLGYVANAQAQALARSTTGLIGLVVHDIADPYFASIAKGVQLRAREDRHQLLLAARNALIADGQTRFVFLGGPDDLVTSVERREGFRDALEEGGLSPVLELAHAFTSEGGYASVRDLIAESSPAQLEGLTLVAANDVMALGAIAAFRHAGLRVPDDVRVAGFDDIPTLRDFSPGLTTIRFPLEDVGVAAARIVLAEDQPRHVPIVGELVRRESA
jgi:LacI family transcriptional regulator